VPTGALREMVVVAFHSDVRKGRWGVGKDCTDVSDSRYWQQPRDGCDTLKPLNYHSMVTTRTPTYSPMLAALTSALAAASCLHVCLQS
jgi:hypothetical protein